MSGGSGTIDYDVEAHTVDAHKTSAVRQESTTRNLQLQDLISECPTVLLIRQLSHLLNLGLTISTLQSLTLHLEMTYLQQLFIIDFPLYNIFFIISYSLSVNH